MNNDQTYDLTNLTSEQVYDLLTLLHDAWNNAETEEEKQKYDTFHWVVSVQQQKQDDVRWHQEKVRIITTPSNTNKKVK
jgi:hypothetical protein